MIWKLEVEVQVHCRLELLQHHQRQIPNPPLINHKHRGTIWQAITYLHRLVLSLISENSTVLSQQLSGVTR